MGNICNFQHKAENYSDEALSDRLHQVTKKNSANVIYDVDKSTCFKSEIGPQEQMMNVMENVETELDESCL